MRVILAVRFAPEAVKVCEAEGVPTVVAKPDRLVGETVMVGVGTGILKALASLLDVVLANS